MHRAAYFLKPRRTDLQLGRQEGAPHRLWRSLIFVSASSNQQVTNSHQVRTLVVHLVVCWALKLVIDPAIFIDRENLFDHTLVQIRLRTNHLWPRSMGPPCAGFVDDEHIEIAVTPVTACVEGCKRLVRTFLLEEVCSLGCHRLSFLLSGMFRFS